MQLSPNDGGMDWEKILESLDEAKIPQDMTKEEFAAMSAAREARAVLSAGDFNESDGWQEFVVLRDQQRIRRIRFTRLAIAASVVMALGAALWLVWPSTQLPQMANVLPTGKVRLKTSNGQVIDLNQEMRTIQDNNIAKVNAGGDSLVYMARMAASAEVKMDTLEVPRGKPFQLALADGSRVWLNAASRLVFPATFNGPRREVFLEGEGYFDVAQKTNQPFIVHAGKTATTVLGTSFNIRYYDAAVVTTLRNGKVQVSAGEQTLLLQPNEQSTFLAGNGSLQKQSVESGDYMAWVKGDLYFDVAPLNRITESLSRYYDYTFKFDDAATGNLSFTLDMPRPATLQEVLIALKASRTDLRFKVDGKTVTISRQR